MASQVIKKHGFTIIELTIVIGVLSVFLLMLYGSYFQIQNFLFTQTKYTKESSHALSSINLLVKDMNSMVFQSWNKKVYFKASKKSCQLGSCSHLEMSSTQYHDNPSAIQLMVNRVEYFVDLYKNKPTLFRSINPFYDDSETKRTPAIPILEGLEEFVLEFSPDGENWQEEWDFIGTPTAPQVVKIMVAYKTSGSDKTKKMTILVRPAIMTRY